MRNLIAFTLLLSTACIEDVAKDKVAAKVTEADSTKAETTEPSETELGKKYAVDAKASSIEAMAAKITAKHPIQFHDGERRCENLSPAHVPFLHYCNRDS